MDMEAVKREAVAAAADVSDIALSPFLTSLSDYVPLPFRVLSLISLGILCWAFNLHVLHILGIDTSFLLDIRSPSDASEYLHPSKLYRPIYQLAAVSLTWTTLAWFIGFRLFADSDGDSSAGRLAAAFTWLVPLIVLLLPVDRFRRAERFMFLRALRRTALDGILQPVAFCDVILADVLTTFAKILGDLWVCVCMILNLNDADESGYKQIGVPIMIALPYLFRFRQCISEYINTPWEPPPGTSLHASGSAMASLQPHHHHGHGHQPSIFMAPSSAATTPASPKKRSLFNALKYASAFPVIFFSALQGRLGDPHDVVASSAEVTAFDGMLGRNGLFRIWVISVLINSLYSFWWDVTNDWGLHLLLPSRVKAPVGSAAHFGLRKTMLLPDVVIYFLVVALDFILRFTWSLKLSSHLHTVHEMEAGIFLLEALEVVRRCMWVFVRLEWEAVRKGGDALEERMARSPTSMTLPMLDAGTPSAGYIGERKVSASHRKVPTRDDDVHDGGRSGVMIEVPKGPVRY